MKISKEQICAARNGGVGSCAAKHTLACPKNRLRRSRSASENGANPGER
jgi:hypothetical protein